LATMGSLETLSHLETVSTQYIHCPGFVTDFIYSQKDDQLLPSL